MEVIVPFERDCVFFLPSSSLKNSDNFKHSPLVGSIKGPANGSDVDRFMESPLQYPSTKSFLRTLVDGPISQCSYLLLVAPPGIFKPGRVPLLLRDLWEQDVVELWGVPRRVRWAPPVQRAGSCWDIWWDFLGKNLFINWNFAASRSLQVWLATALCQKCSLENWGWWQWMMMDDFSELWS